MKLIFSLLLFISVKSFGQEIVLVDKDLKKPVEYVSSSEVQMISNGRIPIYRSEVDSIVKILGQIKNLFVRGKRSEAEYFHFATEHSIFNVRRYRYEDNDLYSIIFTSKNDQLGTGLVISNKRNAYKKTLAFIDQMIAYLMAIHPA